MYIDLQHLWQIASGDDAPNWVTCQITNWVWAREGFIWKFISEKLRRRSLGTYTMHVYLGKVRESKSGISMCFVCCDQRLAGGLLTDMSSQHVYIPMCMTNTCLQRMVTWLWRSGLLEQRWRPSHFSTGVKLWTWDRHKKSDSLGCTTDCLQLL
jgi:hypothetical protein